MMDEETLMPYPVADWEALARQQRDVVVGMRRLAPQVVLAETTHAIRALKEVIYALDRVAEANTMLSPHQQSEFGVLVVHDHQLPLLHDRLVKLRNVAANWGSEDDVDEEPGDG